jgi:4-phytase / acid phosphatase
MNPVTAKVEPEPSTRRPKLIAGGSLKIFLAVLLLALASGVPVPAQTTNAVDDGTSLKAIIVFSRHSIRCQLADTNTLDQFSADPYPDFVGVPVGYLTPNGQQAEHLLGTYFHDYLLHEGLLTGNADTDLAHSYFRANSIERSYMTASKFGTGLIPGANIPVHTYSNGVPDPVFDPLLAGVATVDPVRALTEVQGIYGSGASLTSAYSSEIALTHQMLYPPGTQPINPPGTQPANNAPIAPQGSYDPSAIPIMLATNAPLGLPNTPPYYTGNVIDMGGLNSMSSATDPFIMQYADNFPTNEVGWGRLSLDNISTLTRLGTLQITISMRQPYLAKVQSSNAGSHVLRSLEQVISGEPRAGAFGTPQTPIQVIVSSDYYVAGLAGLLGMHWCLPGYQPDFCAPGGTLVFELRQITATGQYIVRVFYTAQTFDQLRNLIPLTLANPPATMQLLIPGGNNSATNLDVDFGTFSNLLTQAIGSEYVQPFAEETPPGVLDPYTADNPTNITASVSGITLTLAWPADHAGWILQARTNGLGSSLPANWFDLPGTGNANSVIIPVDPANPAVFYRLRRPF